MGPDGVKWPEILSDAEAALEWILASAVEQRVDRDRIAIVGTSSGGHLAAMLGVASASEKVQGVVAVSALLVPRYFDDNRIWSEKYQMWVDLKRVFGGTYSEMPNAWEAASLTAYLDEDDPPFLLIHGTRDGTLPIAQAEMMHAAMRRAGVRVDFVSIEGGDHEIMINSAFDEVLQEMETFLTAVLRE